MANSSETADAIFENLRLELRRGSLILSVLAALRSEQYGYSLRKILEDHGLSVEESTLYPLLRRLESQGLLLSEWRETAKRTKRFYRLSEAGREMLHRLITEWRNIDKSIKGILSEPEYDVNRQVSTVDSLLPAEETAG